MPKSEIEIIEEIKQELVIKVHSLIIIVGDFKKNTLLKKKLQNLESLTTINLNLHLSEILTSMSGNERTNPVEIIEEILLDVNSNNVIFLGDNNILFDSNLKWNPLEIFKKLSRTYHLLVLWDGTLDGKILKYAHTGHAEFREFQLPDSEAILIMVQ